MVRPAQLQKKIVKLLEKFVHRPNMIILLEDAASHPEVEVLRQPSTVDSFEGDIDAIKSELKRAFRFLARVRGKRTIALEEEQECLNQLSDMQEELVEGKRPVNVHFNREENEAKRRRTISYDKDESANQLTKEQKAELKEIANKISKLPNAIPFLYPAIDVGSEAEMMIEEKFGKQYVDVSWKKKKRQEGKPASKPTSKSAHNHTKAPTDIMTEFLDRLAASPHAEPFLYPVDPQVAPGYEEMIKNPMDLSTVRKRLKSGFYKGSVSLVLSDIELIWQNCLEYNEPKSEIAIWAKELSNVCAVFCQEFNLGPYDISDTTEKAELGYVVPAEPMPDSRLKRPTTADRSNLSEKDMGKLIESLLKFEHSASFVYPVDLDDAPGYLDVVRRPMDLSTVERRFQNGKYRDNPNLLISDIHLIWENCRLYNSPSSTIYKAANICQGYVDQFLQRVPFPDEIEPQRVEKLPPKEVIVVPSASEKKVEDGDEEVEEEAEADGDMDVDEEMEHAEQAHLGGEEDNENAKKQRKRHHVTFRVRKYRSVMRQVFTHELAEPFRQYNATSALLPGVVNALDLMTIKERIEEYQSSPIRYLSDMKLVFDNYLNNCDPESEIYKSALFLKDFVVDVFYKNFPSLTSARGVERMENISNVGHAVECTSVGRDGASAKSNAKFAEEAKVFSPEVSPIILPIDHRGFAMGEEYITAVSFPFDARSTLDSNIEDSLQKLDNMELKFNQDWLIDQIHHRGRTLLEGTLLPFSNEPQSPEVNSFGSFEEVSNCFEELLVPVGFESKCRVLVALVQRSNAEISCTDYQSSIAVPLINKVKIAAAPGGLSFLITMENGTVISEGQHPREAWLNMIGKEFRVLHTLGSKLRRCRAVFNRLCISPDSVPFLEQVPLNTAEGINYYKIITAPMWLREVHRRLITGQYENEYDYAWDMRLIFRNCRTYNLPNSEIYEASTRLSLLFETLLVSWVHNVVEKSIEVVATGPWDDWMHLKYFDHPSKDIFCQASGSKAKKSDLLLCSWCEDQYLPVSIGLSNDLLNKRDSWACSRCVSALKSCKSDLTAVPMGDGDVIEGVDQDTTTYVLAPDIGEGWCRAKRKNKSGVKNVFLSPLGYEVVGKEALASQKVFEEGVDKELTLVREKEFQEGLTSKRKHKRGAFETAPELEGEAFTIGKLVDFELHPEDRLVWLISTSDSSTVILAEEMLPLSGMFGLEIAQVCRRLEGLDNFHLQSKFIQRHLSEYINDLKEEIFARKRKLTSFEESSRSLLSYLAKERWLWRKQYFFPQRNSITLSEQDRSSDVAMPHNMGFKPFLLGNLQHSMLEVVLVLWDFLEALQPYLGQPLYSLLDLIKSIQPPYSSLTSCSQMIFDEVNCALTQFLLDDIRNHCVFTDDEWFTVLALNPINVLTWPAVAERLLIALSLPLVEDDLKRFMLSAYSKNQIQLLKVLCLLVNHPFFDATVGEGELIQPSTVVQRLNQVVHQLINFDADEMEDVDFIDDIIEILEVDASSDIGSSVRKHAIKLLLWFKTKSVHYGLLVESKDAPVDENGMSEGLVFAKRSWGSYTLRSADVWSNFILTPQEFYCTESSPLEIKMRVLENLERTLMLFADSDCESWTPSDRVAVYHIMVDYGICCSPLATQVKKAASYHSHRLESLTKSEDNSVISNGNSLAIKQVIHLPKRARCHFTGLASEMAPDPSLWTTVPAEYQNLLASSHSDGSRGMMDQQIDKIDSYSFRERAPRFLQTNRSREETVYALKFALEKVVHYRKMATIEDETFKVNLTTFSVKFTKLMSI
eukprot:scaffold268_cov210-Ochromonas_danica.AAC.25